MACCTAPWIQNDDAHALPMNSGTEANSNHAFDFTTQRGHDLGSDCSYETVGGVAPFSPWTQAYRRAWWQSTMDALAEDGLAFLRSVTRGDDA